MDTSIFHNQAQLYTVHITYSMVFTQNETMRSWGTCCCALGSQCSSTLVNKLSVSTCSNAFEQTRKKQKHFFTVIHTKLTHTAKKSHNYFNSICINSPQTTTLLLHGTDVTTPCSRKKGTGTKFSLS